MNSPSTDLSPSASNPPLTHRRPKGSAGPENAALDHAMTRYARGDSRAFSVVHRGLRPRLARYLARRTGSQALADDLLQETFLRIHRARTTFTGGSVVPWAFTIARNVHLDLVRAGRRCPEGPSAGDAPLNELAVADTAESSAIASQAARTAERVLACLPARQREAFYLIQCEDLGVQAAAAALGASPGAVKVRAFRAREALRAALDERRAEP